MKWNGIPLSLPLSVFAISQGTGGWRVRYSNRLSRLDQRVMCVCVRVYVPGVFEFINSNRIVQHLRDQLCHGNIGGQPDSARHWTIWINDGIYVPERFRILRQPKGIIEACGRGPRPVCGVYGA